MKSLFVMTSLALVFASVVACSEDVPGNAGTSAAGAAGVGGTAGAGGAVTEAGVAGDAVAEADVDAAFVCDPPAQPGTFYALEAQSLDRWDPVSMCELRGKVALVVNIAAKCGYTPQLGTLAEIQTKYRDDGLVILGFYCDQFANQAGDEEERWVCQENYGVNFEVFDIINVNPPEEHPIFSWFKSQEGFAGDVQWNFEKFLVSRDGQLLGRWGSTVTPDSPELTAAIEEALAQTPQ